MPRGPPDPSAGEADNAKEAKKIDTYLESREVFSRCPIAVLVDAFRFAGPCRNRLEDRWRREGHNAPSAHVLYFLSHFHSDHYAGLTSSQASSMHAIFASRATAELAVTELGIPRSRIMALDFGRHYCFSLTSGALLGGSSSSGHTSTITSSHGDGESVPMLLTHGVSERDVFYVHLIPANHCPGAAMFLFMSAAFGTILHTGDFRFNGSEAHWWEAVAKGRCFVPTTPTSTQQHQPSSATAGATVVPSYEYFIEDNPALRRVAGNVDTLFLDNTFCDPKFRFLPQWRATQSVIERVRALFLQEDSIKQNSPGGTVTAVGRGGNGPETISCVVLVGTYKIGKERVALAVQDAFAPLDPGSASLVPIHTSPSKYSLLASMGFHNDRFAPLSAAALQAPVTSKKEQHEERSPASPPPPSSARTTRGSATHQQSTLTEVRPAPMAVSLPTCVEGGRSASDNVARPLFEGYNESSALGEEAESEETREPVEDSLNHGTLSSSSSSEDRRHFLLTIVLVPFGAVSYPALAPACGRPLRNANNTNTSDSSSTADEKPLLSIGDGLGLDLSRYDRVLAVEPTGWAKKPTSQAVTRTARIYKVPYSEHCAFDEMLSFVGFVNPRRVVPTVDVGQYRAYESMFVERAPRLGSRLANVQPLTRFAFTCGKRKRSPDTVKREASSGERGATGTTDDDRREPEVKSSNPFAANGTRHASAGREAVTTTAGQIGAKTASGAFTSHLGRPPGVATLSLTAMFKQADSRNQVPHPRDDSPEGGCVVVSSHPVVIEISDDDDDDANPRQ